MVKDPALARQLLSVFEGRWNTSGELLDDAGKHAASVAGTDTYQWVAGGSFMLHTVDVRMGNDRKESVEIIGYNPSAGKFAHTYYDNAGNKGEMEAVVNRGLVSITGEGLRFSGGFNEKGTELSGSWERWQGGEWKIFMHITLIKQETTVSS